MAMNTGKIVVGGLVAGLLFNIGDFVLNSVVLAQDNAEFLKRLGIDPATMESFAGIAPWIVIDFLFGFLVVWTYACIRPRLGPGVTTAIIAGLIPYLGATLVLFGFTSMGVFPMAMFVKASLVSLVNTAIGSVAGAWVYTEA